MRKLRTLQSVGIGILLGAVPAIALSNGVFAGPVTAEVPGHAAGFDLGAQPLQARVFQKSVTFRSSPADQTP